MLRLLSGRKHQVITGVCLVVNGQPSVASETTLVTVSELTDKEIADYVSSGEPMDKAGAYAIQGIASRWIPRIEGDYSNVVGLPVALVWRMLREMQLRSLPVREFQQSADLEFAPRTENFKRQAAWAFLLAFLPALSSTA